MATMPIGDKVRPDRPRGPWLAFSPPSCRQAQGAGLNHQRRDHLQKTVDGEKKPASRDTLIANIQGEDGGD
jgi:hypothetical protein